MKYTHKGTNIFIEDAGSDLFRIHVVRDGKQTSYWQNEAWKYRNCASLARYFYKRAVEDVTDPSWLERAVKAPVKHEPHTQEGFKEWLRERMFQVVGELGTWDTPVRRYIKETRETWKQHSFLFDGCSQNKPRWMDRLDHCCQEQYEAFNPECEGFRVLVLMRDEKWDTPYYDLDAYIERRRNREL